MFLRPCWPFKSMKKTENLLQICCSDMKLSTEKPPKVVYGLSGISVYLSSLYTYRKMYYIYLKFRLCGTGTVFFSSGVPEFGASLDFNCLPGWLCVLDASWKMETFLSEGWGFSVGLGCTPTIVAWLGGAAGKGELEDILARCMCFLRSVASLPKQNCLLSPIASG